MIRSFTCVLLLAVPAAAQEPAPAPREKLDLREWRTGERKKQLLAAGGGDAKTEAAVAAGLNWLAPQQQEDGTWRLSPGSSSAAAAATGLVLLCFFGAGHAPGDDGDYGKRLANGIAALVKMQDPKTGLLKIHGGYMYQHAISALALVEAYALTRDPNLKEPCQRAIDAMAKAQHKEGGWRYDPVPHYPGDASITGWVVQALTAAKRFTDLTVPAETLERADQFLDRCARGEKKATFAYVAYAGQYDPKKATTASAACSKLGLGTWAADDERLGVAVGEFLKRPPAKDGETDAYFIYYATRAALCRGGDDWKAWNPKLREFLLGTQKADGSWPHDRGPYGRTLGPVGCSCLYLLALETYYRYPPPGLGK